MKIMGAMMKNGTRMRAAKIGTVSSTRTTATILPRYMDAIRPQTNSFCSMKSIGPGLRPQIMRPPIMTAAVAEPGIPSESIGRSALVPAAGSAGSGAVIPSGAAPRQMKDGAPNLAPFHFRRDGLDVQLVFNCDHELADPEQAHDRHDKAHAFDQLVDSHCEAHAAGHGVDADGGNGKTDRERDDGLDRGRAAHADEARKGKEINRKIFRRPECERYLRNPRGEQGDENDAHQRAEGCRSESGGKRGRRA